MLFTELTGTRVPEAPFCLVLLCLKEVTEEELIGMLLENAVISISLANYSFIQPMILVALFFIGLIRKERCSKLNLIGSVICVIGVVLFQIM